MLRVDPEVYPTLHALSDVVLVKKCGEEDVRRSDGRAAPLIIATGGRCVDPPRQIELIAQLMWRKLDRLSNTAQGPDEFRRDILVVHDVPRRHFFEGFGRKWEPLLGHAVRETNLLDHFDEIWFVTASRNIKFLVAERVEVSLPGGRSSWNGRPYPVVQTQREH
jgi:hypothetical protein